MGVAVEDELADTKLVSDSEAVFEALVEISSVMVMYGDADGLPDRELLAQLVGDALMQ